METNPLAQLVKQLVQLQESQHHTLRSLQEQQQRALQTMAETQTADRAMLMELLQREPAGPAPPRPLPDSVRLQKMGPDDDPEVYIELFERVAAACGWPGEEWSLRLLPLLSGEAQQAARSLPAAAAADYNTLRAVIWERVGLKPEGHRRRMRELSFSSVGRPFAYAQQLLDSCRRWLQPEQRSQEEIVEQVVLEQFVAGLPKGTSDWLRCHGPTTLGAAIELAENHISVVESPGTHQQSSLSPLAPPGPTKSHPKSSPPSLSLLLMPRAIKLKPWPLPSPNPSPPVSGRAGVQKMAGQACWQCGRGAHFREECPLMEANIRTPVLPCHQASPTPAKS